MNPHFRSLCLSFSLLCAVSCSDDTERNIILETDPFVEERFPYTPPAIDGIVSAVQKFALANEMDFLIARESLPKGDFNATAAGRNLNLKVMHSGVIDGRTAVIFAVARSKPSKADYKKAREFACAVGGRCR
jgi:hypothetical protein